MGLEAGREEISSKESGEGGKTANLPLIQQNWELFQCLKGDYYYTQKFVMKVFSQSTRSIYFNSFLAEVVQL